MAFSRLGGDTAAAASGTDLSVTWPGGLSANHQAVITISWYEGGVLVDENISISTPPSGFTLRDNVVINGVAADESRYAVYTKDVGGGESGDITITLSGETWGQATLDVYSGDGDLTFNSISAADTGSGDNATAPSVSGTTGQGLVCCYGLTDPPGATNSGPSDMTIGSDATGASANACRTYWQALTSTGATGTKTWDFTNTRFWGGFSILIDDAGAVGGGGSRI